MTHRWYLWPLASAGGVVVVRLQCAKCGALKPDGWRVAVGGRLYPYGAA